MQLRRRLLRNSCFYASDVQLNGKWHEHDYTCRIEMDLLPLLFHIKWEKDPYRIGEQRSSGEPQASLFAHNIYDARGRFSQISKFLTLLSDCTCGLKESQTACCQRPFLCLAAHLFLISGSQLHDQSIVKMHSCRLCYKTFNFSSNVRRHERIHTGEKPYRCKVCGKRFNDKGNLKRHFVVHVTPNL